MLNEVKIDFITFDKNNNEYVMYLVEDGPWPESYLEKRLLAIQERIYYAVDVAIDGQIIKKLPEAKSYNIRIQIDFHCNPPKEAVKLVENLSRFIEQSDEYQTGIKQSQFIEKLRIVMEKK
jgi:hypothetical protein